MAPTPNQLLLATLAGKLEQQILSQFGPDVEGLNDAVMQGAADEKARLNGSKATAADFIATGTGIANGVAIETKNQDAINLVADVTLLTNELVEGEILKALPEGFKVVADIRQIVKDAKK